MIPLPAGWPAPSDDAVTDEVVIDIPEATWLDGPETVDSFSVKRDLVGSLLPGQVRAGTGLSVASGQASCAVPGGTPWRNGPAKVKPGGVARLYAQAVPGVTIPLGTFSVDQPAGVLSSSGVSVDLLDANLADRQINRFLGTIDIFDNQPVESAWIVDTLARQLGFFSTPAPVASCVLSVPFAGSLLSELPLRHPSIVSGYPTGWDASFGTVTMVGDASGAFYNTATLLPMSNGYAAATFTGQTVIKLSESPDDVNVPTIVIIGENLYVGGSVDTEVYAGGPIVRGDDLNHPDRLEIQFQRIGAAGSYTAFRARARSSATSTWSEWVTDPTPATTALDTYDNIGIVNAEKLNGFQVCTEEDPALWAIPTASIYPLGNQLRATSVPPSMDAWGGIQDVCASNLGAAFITADNHLKVRDFRWMIGNRPTDGTLQVLDDLDDLAWSVDATDIADRVEVSYRPPDIQRSSATADPEMWKAEDAYAIPGRGSIDVVIDRKISAWVWNFYPEWDTGTGPVERYSRWNARPNRDGSGGQPPSDALSFSLRAVNSTRSVLTVTNTRPNTLYTVNDQGEPSVVLRGDIVMSQETEAIVAVGAPADRALSPLRVDLGIHCQRTVDAQRVAEFVQNQTQTANWKAGRVLVPFDWRRELGDIYQMTEPDTGLNVKVLIVGLELQGEPGNYQQFVDLVVLSTTIYDFNTAWDAHDPDATIADFNTVWAGKTAADFNVDPFATTI